MHTVGCAVCTMRDSEGLHIVVRLIQQKYTPQINTYTHAYTHTQTRTREITGGHLQEHQACP